MLHTATQPAHLVRLLPHAARALPGAKQRRFVVVTLCLAAAGCLSFWQGTVYQHGIDRTLISQYAPATDSQPAVSLSVPTTTASSAPPDASGAPPGP